MKIKQSKFQSFLNCFIQAYIQHKQSIGCKYETEEWALMLFDKFLITTNSKTIEHLSPELLDTFMASRPRKRPRSYNHLLGVIRRFLEWLVLQGQLVQSPLLLRPRKVTSQRLPFIFNDAQAKQLLIAASQLPDNPTARHRGKVYPMIFALLYNLGLRVGEVERLCIKDIDLDRKLLIIRNTKFNKSRYVPFGSRMAEKLKGYLEQRPYQITSLDNPVFTFDGYHPVLTRAISRVFRQLIPHLRLTIPQGVLNPRLHDLRHSFAVGTLLKWYQSGTDPRNKLIHLSTFLGHVNPMTTAVYLQITTELLRAANQYYENYTSEFI
jgi:integrase